MTLFSSVSSPLAGVTLRGARSEAMFSGSKGTLDQSVTILLGGEHLPRRGGGVVLEGLGNVATAVS